MNKKPPQVNKSILVETRVSIWVDTAEKNSCMTLAKASICVKRHEEMLYDKESKLNV
jgi:hypothetical protein